MAARQAEQRRARAETDLLSVAAWSIVDLAALVDAAPRPCAQDPGLFFPVGTTGRAAVQAETARRVCGGCPVRAACLALALFDVTVTVDGAREVVPFGADGIWGATTADERRALASTWRAIRRLAAGGDGVGRAVA